MQMTLMAGVALAALAGGGCAATTQTTAQGVSHTTHETARTSSSGARAINTGFTPISTAEWDELKASVLFTDDDVAALRMSRAVLEPRLDDLLDVWYGFVASTPHLLAYFSDPKTTQPDGDYLAAVRKRFGQWILDTAAADYDEKWLAWQHEIGLRHHSTKKNRTDGGKGPSIVHFRHMVALTIPVTTTLKPFLERGDHTPEEVERMHQAWVKSVLLQVILWSHPYVNDGEF